MKSGFVLAFVSLAAALFAQQPGPLPAGGFLLDDGWRLRPAGKQVPLSTLPMSAAVSPDGKYVLVLNAGPEPPSISVLDAAGGREIHRTPVPDCWLGVAFSPLGDRVYVGGGSEAAVFEFNFSQGLLTPARVFSVVPKDKRTPLDFIGDVVLDPAGHLLYAADLFRDSIVVINPQSGRVIDHFRTGRRPYRILFHPDGKSLFVSSWADGAVYHHETAGGSIIEKIRLGAHPTDMVWLAGTPPAEDEKPNWVARLFVAAANTNNVYVVGVTAAQSLTLVETVDVSMTPWQPAGMTPSALALSPDGKRLFIVCSDVNAVAVADVSGVRSRPLGFIPTGSYPTAVRVLGDDRLVVVNGHGGPGAAAGAGTASFIDPPDEDRLAQYSETVLENCPYRDDLLESAGTPPGSPIPARLGDPSPIVHVIYIVNEGRSYSQDRRSTPNRNKLARDFVLLDNFYAIGDSAAAGQQWSTAALASDFVQKLEPAFRRLHRADSDFESAELAAIPPSAYLWTNAAMAGLSLRNYGFFASNRPPKEVAAGVQVESVHDPVLNRVTNLHYRGFDPAYPDTGRARAFLDDMAQFEKTGRMPQLMLLRMANAADNDAALGMIVQAVTHSSFWPSTAVFVVEASAPDSRPVPALVISPYVRRGREDHSMYSTLSVLRTVELILGLRPMTTFDAGAPALAPVFQAAPDPRPYDPVPR
jgi:DNA-binding beta-propeller fold protein YncE